MQKLYTLALPSGAQVRGLFPREIVLKPGEQVRVRVQLTDPVVFPCSTTAAPGQPHTP